VLQQRVDVNIDPGSGRFGAVDAAAADHADHRRPRRASVEEDRAS
jgi:hypothetical protein